MYSSENRINLLRYRAEAESGLAYRLHIQDDYDIECAYLEMGTTKIMAASTNWKAKKLAWMHCDPKKLVSDPEAYAEKAAKWYRRFDKVICVSEGVKENYDALFSNACPSEILYNVVDDAEIRRKAEAPLPQSLARRRLTLVSFGRLTKQKNYLRLLRTHERLLKEGLDHDLWIAGEGEDRSVLEAFIRERHLEQSVFLPGFLENPYPCIREADLAACSSLYEGFSTFLTECIILGKPIVTTEVSGAKELLGDSEYGLVTANDDEAFYTGLRTILADEALRQRYTEKAALRSQAFSMNRQVETTETFFQKLLEK